PYTVIGVMAREFSFVRNASLGAPQGADAYVPLDVDLSATDPNSGSYAGLVRARPGTSPAAFEAAVAAVGSAVDERDFASRGVKLYPVPLKRDLVTAVRPALTLLGCAGALLLVVLMLNLGTLLLARAAQREQSFAVSRALGAGSSALVRVNLLEGMLLGLLGGVAGTMLAVWGTRALVSLAPLDLPRRSAIAVDASTAAVVIGAGVLIGLLAASAPAVWAARAPLSMLLGNAAVRGGGGHGRMRRGMVVTQVALSLVLLTVGGLVARSFERLLRVDPGFRAEGVLTLRVPMSSALYPELEEAFAVQDRLLRELSALPGVAAAGATSALPLSADASQTSIRIPGAPGNTGAEEHDAPLIDYMGVRPGYMEAMGMQLLAGRMLDERGQDGMTDVVVDHALAEHFFPNGNPLGAIIPFGGDSLRVVGVVRQARLYDVYEDGRPQLYMRSEFLQQNSLSFVVRTERDPAVLVPEVRSVVRRLDAQLPVADVRTMDDVVGDALRQQHVTAVLIAGFSLGALLLAAMGLFGVVSATVTRRKHEIAVRLALGADHGRVLRMVLGDGTRLIVLGLLVGVPVTLLAARALRGMLVGVSPTDPVTLTAVGVGMGAVALTACYLPARRVLRIEPARSLREE
ncbi:MAG: ABC transporter permease, partial [Thioalkalivibrio sp.]|nr:ABC transporter permease [Thioalkalivibrio sp.]